MNRARYAQLNVENRAREVRASRAETAQNTIIEKMSKLALLVALRARHVLGGELSLGSLVLFAQFTEMFLRPLSAL